MLELVGELEDHFGIAVPLDSLTHIRTVGRIVTKSAGSSRTDPRQVVTTRPPSASVSIDAATKPDGCGAIEQDGRSIASPYPRAAAEAYAIAGRSRRADCGPDDRVALVIPEVSGFVRAFFGICRRRASCRCRSVRRGRPAIWRLSRDNRSHILTAARVSRS